MKNLFKIVLLVAGYFLLIPAIGWALLFLGIALGIL